MKKTIVMLATASALVAGMASCKKKEKPEPQQKEAIQQSESVELSKNQSYTFTLPKNLRNDTYEFVTQAQHASVSQIGEDSSGDPIYQYTPAAGYVGADRIVVSNDQEREEMEHHPPHHHPLLPPLGGKHKKHDCKGEPEDHYIITINFIVKDELKDSDTY